MGGWGWVRGLPQSPANGSGSPRINRGRPGGEGRIRGGPSVHAAPAVDDDIVVFLLGTHTHPALSTHTPTPEIWGGCWEQGELPPSIWGGYREQGNTPPPLIPEGLPGVG